MGNCGSNPKTNEGPEPVAEPEVKVDAKVEETKSTEETPIDDNKSLSTLLNENVEGPKNTEQVIKAGAVETEEVKVQEEVAKTVA